MRTTEFSPCRKYRYTLWREFVTSGDLLSHERALETASYVQFIGLNPSTADETKDDPTIRRCIGFAKAWGYGAMCMTNLFAFRATQPEDMKKCLEPVGTENEYYLLETGKKAGLIVAAWGVHGIHLRQNKKVHQAFVSLGLQLNHLGLSKDGHPKHPLYLKADTKPIPFP